jgi:hypothetical protein
MAENAADGEAVNDTTEGLDALEAELGGGDDGPRDGEWIGTEGDDQAEQMSSAEVCTMAVSTTFALVAARRGDHWQLQDAEAQQMGEAYGALLDKYFPDSVAGPEVAAVLVTATVIFPRAMADKAAQAEAEASEAAGDETAH